MFLYFGKRKPRKKILIFQETKTPNKLFMFQETETLGNFSGSKNKITHS